MKPYRVQKAGALFEILLEVYPEQKKTKLKQLLKYGAVTVNGHAVSQFDYALGRGDEIVIRNYKPEFHYVAKPSLSFPIVYEDERLIVIEKPAGLLTMSNDKEKIQTAYFELTAYARGRTRDSSGRVFIVHRLDRDASGLLLFAKDEEMKLALQANWESVEKNTTQSSRVALSDRLTPLKAIWSPATKVCSCAVRIRPSTRSSRVAVMWCWGPTNIIRCLRSPPLPAASIRSACI